MTQYDVSRIKNIESHISKYPCIHSYMHSIYIYIHTYMHTHVHNCTNSVLDTKLTEYPVNESEALSQLNHVTTWRKEVELVRTCFCVAYVMLCYVTAVE